MGVKLVLALFCRTEVLKSFLPRCWVLKEGVKVGLDSNQKWLSSSVHQACHHWCEGVEGLTSRTSDYVVNLVLLTRVRWLVPVQLSLYFHLPLEILLM